MLNQQSALQGGHSLLLSPAYSAARNCDEHCVKHTWMEAARRGGSGVWLNTCQACQAWSKMQPLQLLSGLIGNCGFSSNQSRTFCFSPLHVFQTLQIISPPYIPMHIPYTSISRLALLRKVERATIHSANPAKPRASRNEPWHPPLCCASASCPVDFLSRNAAER